MALWQRSEGREALSHSPKQKTREGNSTKDSESMAVSSISATLIPSLPLPNSSPFPPSKPKLSPFFLASANCSLKIRAVKPSQSFTRVYAAPEVLESQDTVDPPPETLDGFGSEANEVCISSPYVSTFTLIC